MDAILGLTPTGRELRDPAARLVEATDENNRTYTVVDFDAAHDGHNALTLNVEMVLSFMEYPMVTGLVELGKHDIAAGQFAYPTGSVWLLADVIRAYGDFGQVVGLRAAMELGWLVGQILVEAGNTGPMQGCFSHGNINPWRIAVRADGEVQVIGYGLPQVELIRFRAGEGPPLEATSLRYCPPERLEGVPEDPAADTYSLTQVVFEIATGKPLLDTFDIGELQRMVGMSEGATILSRDNKGLPPKVAKLLAKALVYDPDTRLSGKAFVDAVGGLLASEPMQGPSLTEVVAKLQGHQKAGAPKGRKLVSHASTSMFTPEQLAALADEEDEDEEADGTDPQGDSRWKKVARSRNEADEPATVPQRKVRRGEPSDDAPPSRRRRRRKHREPKGDENDGAPEEEEEEEDASDDEPVVETEAQEEEPSEATTSRRRKPPADEPPEATKRSRRRRAPDDATDDAPDNAPLPAPAVDSNAEEPKSSRRRRRKPAEDDAEEQDASLVRRSRATDDDDDDDTPRRRRRTADDDDDDDDAPPRRRSRD